MPRNDIQNLSSLALSALCHKILSALEISPNPYSIPTNEIGALTDAANTLDEKNANVEQAESTYRAAVQQRESARTYAARCAANLARTAYAAASNTPAMIAELGLKPHSTSRTKIVPSTPIELTATPQVGGEILLKWSRFRNPAGVNFIVEGQIGSGEWLFVQDTTASRLTLTGYEPGAVVSFRVSASKNKTTSEPSAAVTFWPASSSTPSLRLAA